MRRRSRELQMFSLSALDLFASAMGTFILIAVILFPYYLKNETTVRQLTRQKAEIEALKRRTATAEKRAREAVAAAERAQARAREAEARARRAQAAIAKPAGSKRAKVRFPGVDIVYVIDTTASMGEGVGQVRSSLSGIVAVLQELAEDVRVGFVAYKARGVHKNDYVMIQRNLSSTKSGGLQAMRAWVGRLRPQGGGTEIMLEAMTRAAGMSWRSNTLNVIVLIADEPGALSELPALLALARRFSSERRRISAFLPPMRSEAGLRGRQRELLIRQRGIVRAWMGKIARAGRGIFMPPERGDLASVTLLTVGEKLKP